MPHTLKKLGQLRDLKAQLGAHYELQVDGGLDVPNAPLVAEAGATVIVAATAIFKSGLGIAEAVRRLRGSVAEQPAVGQG
jgi:ribulose-phosphate 3-epimerase